jgi:putative phosphoribosyl transferase
MGAIADGDPVSIHINTEVVDDLGIPRATIEREITRQKAELDRRQQAYGLVRHVDLSGRAAVLVDDGIATGGTVLVDLQALRASAAARLTIAVPVAPRDVLRSLKPLADDIVCLVSPEPFLAVGQVYKDFAQTRDEEVIALLQQCP